MVLGEVDACVCRIQQHTAFLPHSSIALAHGLPQGWAVEQPTFQLFYRTGWPEATLHYRRVRADGTQSDGSFTSQVSCGHLEGVMSLCASLLVMCCQGELALSRNGPASENV